jgi:hypothetical protein
MNQIELLEHVLGNLKAGKSLVDGLAYSGKDPIWEISRLSHVPWHNSSLYTLAPRTHKVNGFDVPVPESKELKSREQYYTACPTNTCYLDLHAWDCDMLDRRYLKRGLVHLTKEAAIANAKAMIGIDPEAETEE